MTQTTKSTTNYSLNYSRRDFQVCARVAAGTDCYRMHSARKHYGHAAKAAVQLVQRTHEVAATASIFKSSSPC